MPLLLHCRHRPMALDLLEVEALTIEQNLQQWGTPLGVRLVGQHGRLTANECLYTTSAI